jgi:hypothetical protein
MPAGLHVAVRIAILLLPGLLYAAPAMSEGEHESKRTSSTTGSALGPKVWPAPVGHRQPRPADIPQDLPKDLSKDSAEQPRDPRDREIDALLQISTAESVAPVVEINPWPISRPKPQAKPAPGKPSPGPR